MLGAICSWWVLGWVNVFWCFWCCSYRTTSCNPWGKTQWCFPAWPCEPRALKCKQTAKGRSLCEQAAKIRDIPGHRKYTSIIASWEDMLFLSRAQMGSRTARPRQWAVQINAEWRIMRWRVLEASSSPPGAAEHIFANDKHISMAGTVHYARRAFQTNGQRALCQWAQCTKHRIDSSVLHSDSQKSKTTKLTSQG